MHYTTRSKYRLGNDKPMHAPSLGLSSVYHSRFLDFISSAALQDGHSHIGDTARRSSTIPCPARNIYVTVGARVRNIVYLPIG